jgi:TATA-binding protein-associated factor
LQAGVQRQGRTRPAQPSTDTPPHPLSPQDPDEPGALGGGHRLLVFAQLKPLLDLVERDLLQPLGVSYLRLDGSVEASQRFSLVQRFNSDPTIDVLLLTTHVGGLGLNLTSADTVVFLEHDWNPMKDLQVWCAGAWG